MQHANLNCLPENYQMKYYLYRTHLAFFSLVSRPEGANCSRAPQTSSPGRNFRTSRRTTRAASSATCSQRCAQ